MPHDIQASEWLNTPAPIDLSALRGRVVMVTVFQMLCQGCVVRTLPQARQVHQAFSRDDVVVLGLHSVFEHHAVMTPDALRAFVHECRLPFPIAVDAPRGQGVPATMHAWGLQGTPTVRLYGRDGALAFEHFGHVDDLHLGALLGGLAHAPAGPSVPAGGAVCPLPDEHGVAHCTT